MNELITKLLQPVSAQLPCGPDLANDPKDQTFAELETILKGKPEVEVGTVKKPAEPPNWPILKVKSLEFLGKSKDLRVAVMLSASLLRIDGLPGFRDSIQLIRGLLEQYWQQLYPLLDPTSQNDPTQRLNILGALTAPRGSVYGSWLTIIDYLYTAPLCPPKGAPPVTLEDFAAKPNQPAAAGAAANPDRAKLQTVIRGAGPEHVAAQHQAAQQALEAVQGMDHFLTTTLGSGNTIAFDVLEATLKEIVAVLAPLLIVVGEAGAAAATTVGGATGSPAPVQLGGSIGSRDQVIQAIDSICEYYRKFEPSSPVPYVLRRAQKLASMDFVQAMQELKLATVDTLRPSMGSAIEGASAGDAKAK